MALERRKLLFGLLIVAGIGISWVGSTQTSKSTYKPGFNGSFFIVWFSTCWMITCFPLYLLKTSLCNRQSPSKALEHCLEIINSKKFSSLATVKGIGIRIAPFCAIWVATNYVYVKALGIKDFPPTDVTALFSSAPAFVFILSRIILKERVTVLKICAVVMAISGVVLIQYAEGFGSASLKGSFLSIGAAVGAALYKTLFKFYVKDASLGQVAFFLSGLGFLNAVFLWFIFLILNYMGVEVISWSHVPWTYLCSSSALSLLFNFFIAFGIAYTYPLFISFGTVLGIPLNALADRIFRHIVFSWVKVEGSIFIILGFVILLMPDRQSDYVNEGLKVMICLKKRKKRSRIYLNKDDDSESEFTDDESS